MKKYNILFISTCDNYFVENTASFLRMYNNLNYFFNHKDFNVFVLQPKRDKCKENLVLKKNIKTYYYKEIKILAYNFRLLLDFNPFYIIKIMKIRKKYQIDLIHIDYLYGINCLRLFKKTSFSYNAYNVEYIFAKQVDKYYYKLPKIFRGLYTKYVFLLEKYAIKFVDNINAMSKNDKQFFIKIYNTPKNKIILNSMPFIEKIFNNPVDKKNARKKLNIDNNKFVIIFHGSYYESYANQEAISIIKNKIVPKIIDKDILFLIAGKIPIFSNKNNLKFLGFVEDLKNFLYCADIAIAPIMRGSGIKTKIIDYISACLPVITTQKGAEGILFKNGIHGYIINDNNIDDMIEKIKYYKNNPEEVKSIKLNIYNIVKKELKWEDILNNIAEKYKKIIASNRN